MHLSVCVGGLGPQGGRDKGQPGCGRARECAVWETVGPWLCVCGELCPGAVHTSPEPCSLCGEAQVWRDGISRFPLLTWVPAHTQAGAHKHALAHPDALPIDLRVCVSARVCVCVCQP